MRDALDIFKGQQRMVAITHPAGLHLERDDGELIDLSGRERLFKAEAMAPGDLGVLDTGVIVQKDDLGQFHEVPPEALAKARGERSGHKYTSRKRVGNRWVYEYADTKPMPGSRGRGSRSKPAASSRDHEMSTKVRAAMSRYKEQGMSDARALRQLSLDHPGHDMTSLKRWAAGKGSKGQELMPAGSEPPAAPAPKAKRSRAKKPAAEAAPATKPPEEAKPEPEPAKPAEAAPAPEKSKGEKAKDMYQGFLQQGMPPKRAFGELARKHPNVDSKTLNRWIKSWGVVDLTGPDRLAKAGAMIEGDIGITRGGAIVVKSDGRLHAVGHA